MAYIDKIEKGNTIYDIKDSTTYLINEITYENFYNSNSKSYVHIIHVPHTDNKGNAIKIKHGFANDVIDTGIEKASDFSNRNKTTLTINASIGAVQSQVTEQISYGELLGLYIHNGEVIKDNRNLLTQDLLRNRYILGITADGLLKSYQGETSSQTILNDDIIETCQSFIPILVNGQNNRQNLINEGCTYWGATTFTETEDTTPDYDKIYYVLDNGEYIGEMNLTVFESGTTYYEEHGGEWGRYPRQVICQNSNTLDYYIITADGKGNVLNKGLTLNDYTTIAKKYGCNFAFVLDGGGSTTTIYKNVMINNRMDDPTDYSNLYDGTGYTEREVPDFLYFSKDAETENDKNINYLLSEINKLNNKLNDLILKEDQKFMSNTNFYEKVNQQHLFHFNKWDNSLKEFVESMQIYFDNTTSYPGGLNIYDVVNDIQVLRLHNNLSDGIKFLGKKLAYMPDTILEETETIDIDNLPRNFYVAMLQTSLNLTNQPFNQSTDNTNIYWLIQFTGSSSAYYKFQIGIAIKANPIIRVRIKVDGNWQSWIEINKNNVNLCFDTVASMKTSTNLINGNYAQTLGYYAKNDGGGAQYKISGTLPSNGYYETLDNGLYAELIINPTMNVKQFGCKGDGITNDNTNFNKAINSNYDVYIPEGTYLIENITLKNRQKLTGENMTKTIIKSVDNNSNTEIITVGNNNGIYNVISNFSIDGNKNNQITEIDGINLTNTSDSHHYLQMLQIYNCSGNGIYANDQKELRIENCVVRGCMKNGIFLNSSSDNSIISTTVYSCLLNGFRTNAGMNRFTNCKAFSNGRVTNIANDTPYQQRYAGFYDTRGNNYVNCDAQGNYGHGFEFINTNDLSCIGVRTNLNGIQVNSSNEIISFTETPFYDGIHCDHCRYSTIITTALSMYNDDKKCQRYALCVANDNGNSDYLYANINHTNQLSGAINTLPNSVVNYNIIDNGNNINPISNVAYTLNTTGGFEENTYIPLKIEKVGRLITLSGLVYNTSPLVNGTTYKVLTITSSSHFYTNRNIPIQATIRSSQTELPEGLCYGIINTNGQLQIKVPTITNGQYIELHGNWVI